MQFLAQIFADYFPLLLFFAAFKLWGIYAATAVAIAASVVQIAYFRWRRGKVQTVHWLSLAIIATFGGATLLLHDETFIKWKPTVLYWLFSVSLLVAEFGFNKNAIKAMMGKQMVLPESVWRKMLIAWAGFFAMMGVLNLYIAFN